MLWNILTGIWELRWRSIRLLWWTKGLKWSKPNGCSAWNPNKSKWWCIPNLLFIRWYSLRMAAWKPSSECRICGCRFSMPWLFPNGLQLISGVWISRYVIPWLSNSLTRKPFVTLDWLTRLCGKAETCPVSWMRPMKSLWLPSCKGACLSPACPIWSKKQCNK